MGKSLKHANPDTYASDLKDALDEFEDALVWRYEEHLFRSSPEVERVWTLNGYQPPEGTLGTDYVEFADDVPDWAGEIREWASRVIADYGAQDLDKLESAFEDLSSAAKLLGGNREVGDLEGIPDITNDINGQCDFDAWAGPSGEAFRKNFGTSVAPTKDNQTALAASLANLYSGRACIIEAVRSNTINAIKSAAKALRETEDSGAENARWLGVGVATIAIGLVVGAGAGAAISAAATFGGYLDSENPDQKFSDNIKDIVDTLVRKLHQAGAGASSQEDLLSDKVTELQIDIKGAKGEELELYDFTGGDYSPAAPAGGFDVSAETVRKLSELCFAASREYEKVIAKAVSTDDADGELKGEGGVETAADAELIDTKDALVSFLKTTCARYYEAGERLYDTARAYFGAEADSKAVLEALKDDPDLNGDRDGKGGSVGKHVKESNRDDIEDLPESSPGGVEYGSGGV